MEQIITEDEQMYTGHVLDRPRHTQQVDFFTYERQMRVSELPEGRRRALDGGAAITRRMRA